MSHDGWGFACVADPENPSLPHRLEAGAKTTWHVEVEALQKLVDGDRKPRTGWMEVELGTGKMLRTKETIELLPS
jgi:hypothetical protein